MIWIGAAVLGAVICVLCFAAGYTLCDHISDETYQAGMEAFDMAQKSLENAGEKLDKAQKILNQSDEYQKEAREILQLCEKLYGEGKND